MRKTQDKEFKIKVCKDIEKGITTAGNISKEYGISRPIVSRWVEEYHRYKNKAFSSKGTRFPDKAKLYMLQKENEQLRLEDEILKKLEVFVKQKE